MRAGVGVNALCCGGRRSEASGAGAQPPLRLDERMLWCSLESLQAIRATNNEAKPMKVLIVEDETKTTTFLRKGLVEHGFEVDISKEGDKGLSLARTGDYDLLILDVMLPGGDGWSVLAELRRAGKRVPVLFLTARDSIRDRVKGLELGADDYLVKPFAFSELLARVRSVLRRSGTVAADSVQIADLELDQVRRRASRGGNRLELTPKEFTLLALFARRRGEVLSRRLIAEQVWDVHFEAATNVVDVHVRRLRAKVDDPFAQKLIHTVRGAGYVLEDRA
jgi:two-component system copper resistance phosphate regulon response regulator CusR